MDAQPREGVVLAARQETAFTRDEILRGFTWFAVITAVFLLARPYAGIIHDNILYVAQALARLNPDIYRGDVYFQWGSQDRYTFFSPIYSALILHLGLGPANLTLVLVSLGLFLAASFALVRVLVPPGLRGLAMVFIACSNGLYGGLSSLRMAEAFVTPRPLVQAATLFAVLLLVSGRRNWSLAVLAASALLHPLFAFAGMLYWWLYHVIQDRRWWWLLALGVIPTVAGLAGLAPFTQLFQNFDSMWLDAIFRENPMLFVAKWKHVDWGLVVFDLVILLMGTYLAEGVAQRAMRAAIVTAFAALGITAIGVDLLQNVLLTNVQIWRALWIVHWMALAALPFVAARLWSEGATGQLLAGLAVFGFVARGLPVSLAVSLLTAALFCYRRRFAPRKRLVRVAVCVLAGGGFVNWLADVSWIRNDTLYGSINPIVDFIVRALSMPLPLLVVAVALTWFGLARRRDPRLAALIAAGLLAIAVVVWDRRTPLNVYAESAGLGSHPFSRIVAPDQQVLWQWDLTTVWVLMQRKSYFSTYQHAGQMFSRETAMELLRRGKVVRFLRSQERICGLLNRLENNFESCKVDLIAVREVCREAVGLDYIVLETRIGNNWVASWTPPVESSGLRPYYYLYDCKKLAQD